MSLANVDAEALPTAAPFELPPLPPVLEHLLACVEEGRYAEDDLVALVQHDASYRTRLLRVANSTYFASPEVVHRPAQAIQVLGEDVALAVLMTYGLVDLRPSLPIRATFPYLKLVRHCLGAGFITHYLTTRNAAATAQERSRALIAGLLHDCGKILLVYNRPEIAAPYYGFPKRRDTAAQVLLKDEADQFGMNHVDAGAFFLDHASEKLSWLSGAIRHHEARATLVTGEEKKLMNAVHAGSIVANAFRLAFDRPVSIDACVQDPVWASYGELGGAEVAHVDAFSAALQGLGTEAQAFVDAVL